MTEPKIIDCGHCRARPRAPVTKRGYLTDERIHEIIGWLYLKPARVKQVRMDRDEVLALLREVREGRSTGGRG